MSPNRGPAGHVAGQACNFYARPATVHGDKAPSPIGAIDALPRVEIVYAYANMGRAFIDDAVKDGAKRHRRRRRGRRQHDASGDRGTG